MEVGLSETDMAVPAGQPSPVRPPVASRGSMEHEFESPNRQSAGGHLAAGSSPRTMEAETLLAGALGSAAAFASGLQCQADATKTKVQNLASQARRRGLVLNDLSEYSQRGLLALYDVHKLFRMGSDLPSIVKVTTEKWRRTYICIGIAPLLQEPQILRHL